MSETPKQFTKENAISVKDFFESVPPGRTVKVKKMGSKQAPHGIRYSLVLPVIQIHCTTDSCNGVRFFQPTDSESLRPNQQTEHFTTFLCRNCEETKNFMLAGHF